MAKKATSKDYFKFSKTASIIFAIIPVTAWLFGAITRLKEGKTLAGIIRLLGVGFILWLFDLFLIIKKGRIVRLLNC